MDFFLPCHIPYILARLPLWSGEHAQGYGYASVMGCLFSEQTYPSPPSSRFPQSQEALIIKRPAPSRVVPRFA